MLKPLGAGGQGSLEALVMAAVLLALIKGALILFWILIGSLWIEHQLYQALICAAEGRGKSLCAERMKNNIKRLDPAGNIKSAEIKQYPKQWIGEAVWEIYRSDHSREGKKAGGESAPKNEGPGGRFFPFPREFRIRQSLSLP